MIGALPLFLFCGPARAGADSREKDEKSVKAAQAALANAEKNLGPEDPGIIRILVSLARLYEAAGDAAQFPEMEKRLSAIKSKDFEVWLTLGTLLHSQGKFLEADDALKKALSFKPDDLDAEREMADVDQDMGRDEEAVKLFEKLIEKNPREYDLYIRLARSDIRLGRYAQSKEAFAQAKKINGKTTDAYIAEGYFDLNIGEPAQAKEAFQSAIAVDSASSFGYHHLGAYLSRNRPYPEAENYFWQALEKLEADPNATNDDLLHTLGWLGDVIQRQGRSAEAETVYRKCLEKTASSDYYVHCLLSLGELYASQDKNAEAEDVFKQAAAACAEGPACTCRGRGLIGLGNFYMKHGRRREASAMADQAGKLCTASQPSNRLVLIAIADLYTRTGNASQSEALFGQVVNAARSSMPFDEVLPWTMRGMAHLDMTRRRPHEAERLLRKAIIIWENRRDEESEAGALDDLAGVYENEGMPQKAAEAREKAKAMRSLPLTAR